MSWRRGDVLLVGVAVVVAAGCVRLGVWQLDRLSQRRARNAALAARLALPPVILSDASPRTADPDSLDRRRIAVRGVFDYERERVWPARSFSGTPGVALVTPLVFDSGLAVYVDRGWVPSPDAFTVDRRGAFREADTALIEGLAFRAPRGRADVDPSLAGLPYQLLPVVVQQERPEAARGLPRRWPPPALDNGPHLGYAIQWFSFAAIALVGTAVLLRKSTRARGLTP